MADCVNIVTGSGIAPDDDTIVVDPVSGKAKVGRVPADAYSDLGDSLEAVGTLDVACAPDGGLEVAPGGLRCSDDANGAGRRYIGTDHTEILYPQVGDIYYEVA